MEMEDLESICRHSYISIEDAKIRESLSESKKTYHCDDCGYEVELSDDEYTGKCPNCGEHSGFYEVDEESLSLDEKIVKQGSKYQVRSEKGKNMGTYNSREEAEARLKQIERFKHMNESRGGWNQYVYSVGADPSDRELLQQDIEALKHFGLTYLGTTQEPNDPTSGEMFFKGSKHAIADYLDSWVGGIQIVPEYLIPEEDFEDTTSFDYLQDHAIDEGVKIVPDHVTSMQMLNHDLGESVEDTPVIWAVDIVAWEDDDLEKSHIVETVEVTYDDLNDRYHGNLGKYIKTKENADRITLNSDLGSLIRSVASQKMKSDHRSFERGFGIENLRVVKNELPSGVKELGKVLGQKLGLRRESLDDYMDFEGEDQEMSYTLPVDADDEDCLEGLEEEYKSGGERTFAPGEPEYEKIKAVADKLNSMDLVSKWDHRTPYDFSVEDVYLDYGSRWMWTTIVATLQGGGDSHQILSPKEWLDIVNDAVPVDTLVDEMLADEYAQFERSQKEQECLESKLREAKKVDLTAAAKRTLERSCKKLEAKSSEEIYNNALEVAGKAENSFVKDNLTAKKDAAIEFINKYKEATNLEEGLREDYDLVYHFGREGDDEYSFSCSYRDALKALKDSFTEEELVDMVEDSSFDPELDDFDDFLLSNIDSFEDFLHDYFEEEAERQYELDKDYEKEFDPSK